jgi:hypothetical protein
VDHPSSAELPDGPGQRAASVTFLIRDRAGQFTDSFNAVLTAAGVRILPSPPQHAHSECHLRKDDRHPAPRAFADRLLIINEHHLRQAPAEYLRHYNTARLSPLDLSVNRSLGAQIGAQLRGVPFGTCVISVEIC